MSPTKAKANPALTAAMDAVGNLWQVAFSKLNSRSEMEALLVNTQIKHANIDGKRVLFYRSFVSLRAHMLTLLADTFRQYFKIALAHDFDTGQDPDRWASVQLQPAIHEVIQWSRDWYVLACEGENRYLVTLATAQALPGQTVTTPIHFPDSSLPPPPPWRAPSWLFGVSVALFGFGFGGLKPAHVPNDESAERLGPSHTRLLLKGAKRVFLWELQEVIARVRNEEIAAAGAVRPKPLDGLRRRPNQRKGWETRESLYDVIRDVLTKDAKLEGTDFCDELDKRHAKPLVDWIESGEWEPGMTWRLAWRNPELRRKIRRVRQEAKKKS